ncbi:MAG: DUF881 domain-containing protein [Nocardioides sp.]|uniref:DUF881 domain-containing protein n=1 Tax=Nocardioides sp. TaxID=35761 RepID=UPI0039E4E902
MPEDQLSPEPDSPEPDDPEPDGPEPDPRHADPSARSRLVQSLLHPRRGQALAAVLLALVGFAAVTQVRSNVDDTTYAGSREEDLVTILNGLAGATQRAQQQLSDLRQTKSELQSSTDKREAALDQAQDQVGSLSILAGLVPVKGPGITIEITEKTGEVKVDALLDLIEELRSNGAEAIEINGKVRLVAQSYVEESVGGISVDGTELSSPYTITAIGEPATLKGAVTFTRGPESELEDDGASVQVEQHQSVEIRSVHSG